MQLALKDARTACLIELRLAAAKLDADAIIGIKFDFNELSTGSGGGILFVAATGTAVRLVPKD
ncbi:heavy metal-binding domain-containing protein [Rhizobium populisoli]|uniref:heavy metal-binding domain-containing protein n=1 Tax=Rhizobium populisoli TaxID=2859785 RepID=UPI0035E41F23